MVSSVLIIQIVFWTTKLFKSKNDISSAKSHCTLRLSVDDYVSMVRIKIKSLK